MQAGLIGENLVSSGGQFTTTATQTAIAAAAVVIKPTPGRLCKILVTSAATAGQAITIFDNATAGSGTVIGVIPIGTTGLITFDMPAQLGITIGQAASLSTGNITISFD